MDSLRVRRIISTFAPSGQQLLDKAEQIVFTQPDSVVRMLTPCYYDTTLTTADQALYNLLYTEALHRSGLSTSSDSMIRISRNYYEHHGDDEHLARHSCTFIEEAIQ